MDFAAQQRRLRHVHRDVSTKLELLIEEHTGAGAKTPHVKVTYEEANAQLMFVSSLELNELMALVGARNR